ncbi:unnamed protein product [Clonostachys solani]|uniref:Uncharacterized protein n=1 Tax=Clonostachys solani TaxID=160281 RepID=A0A9N9YSS8_9HYPO|nr:unnamed protein product [Clonostachys solani]
MVSTSLITIFGLFAFAVADITVAVNDNVKPLPLDISTAVTSTTELLNRSCPEELSDKLPYRPKVLMSTFTDFEESDEASLPTGQIFPSSDGLVRGAIEAWAKHQHLVLRPDEVWFEILTQLNFYMTKHAENIRHLFVDHEGKEEIFVEERSWRRVIGAFSEAIQTRIKTPWLYDWIMPGFTTSDENDELTATVLMMGLMQHYFDFSGGITCGLPKVTLLGERKDWVQLLEKLDYLEEFGEEPGEYAQELRPILSRFVKTWDEPESDETKKFWGQIVRAKAPFSCGGGDAEYDMSGWITGFLKWRPSGDLRVYRAPKGELGEDIPNLDARSDDENGPVVLDGVTYVQESLFTIPIAYAKVPMKMIDYPKGGIDTKAYLLAGNVAVNRTKTSDEKFVRAQPLSAWFMYAPVDSDYKAEYPLYGSHSELVDIGKAITRQCPA